MIQAILPFILHFLAWCGGSANHPVSPSAWLWRIVLLHCNPQVTWPGLLNSTDIPCIIFAVSSLWVLFSNLSCWILKLRSLVILNNVSKHPIRCRFILIKYNLYSDATMKPVYAAISISLTYTSQSPHLNLVWESDLQLCCTLKRGVSRNVCKSVGKNLNHINIFADQYDWLRPQHYTMSC